MICNSRQSSTNIQVEKVPQLEWEEQQQEDQKQVEEQAKTMLTDL